MTTPARKWPNLFALLVVPAVCGCQATAPRVLRPRSPASAAAIDQQKAESPEDHSKPQAAAVVAAARPRLRENGDTLRSRAATIQLTAAQEVIANKNDEPPRPLNAVVEAIPAPQSPQKESIAPATANLSLRDALATSLAQNPDLIVVRGTAEVSAAAVNVAGVYPWNPFAQAQYFPKGSGTSPGVTAASNYYVWLMQRFELGHQRRFREDSALAALGQVRWSIRQAELVNLAQAERLFFSTLYQRQLRDLATDTETLSNRLVEVIDRRFRAGMATNVESVNARVAARQAQRQQRLAEAAYQATLLALRQQLGLPSDAPIRPAGELEQFVWLPITEAFCATARTASVDPKTLAAEMAEARPDVLAARSGAAIARANANLARAARVQDIQAGPIYETAGDGTRYLGVRLQRDFGVFNNGSALAAQRQVEVQQQLLAYDQFKRRATNEATAAIDRYERARKFVAEAFHGQMTPAAGELDQVIAQFEAGRADIVNVLAIQNNLLQDARAGLDLLNEVAQSAALVTQATGLPPERLLAPTPPELLPPLERPAAKAEKP